MVPAGVANASTIQNDSFHKCKKHDLFPLGKGKTDIKRPDFPSKGKKCGGCDFVALSTGTAKVKRPDFKVKPMPCKAADFKPLLTDSKSKKLIPLPKLCPGGDWKALHTKAGQEKAKRDFKSCREKRGEWKALDTKKKLQAFTLKAQLQKAKAK